MKHYFLYMLLTALLSSCAATRSGYVDVAGGGRLYYEERGHGEPLILHHEPHLYYGREAWQKLEQQEPGMPVLLLRGQNDHKGGAPAEQRHLPNAQFVLLPDCGHMMNMEQPQLFNSTVLQFLQQNYPEQ